MGPGKHLSVWKGRKHATGGSWWDLQSTFKCSRTARVTSHGETVREAGLIPAGITSLAQTGLENLLPSPHHVSRPHHAPVVLLKTAGWVSRGNSTPEVPNYAQPSQGKPPATSQPPCFSLPWVNAPRAAPLLLWKQKAFRGQLLHQAAAFYHIKSVQLPTAESKPAR